MLCRVAAILVDGPTIVQPQLAVNKHGSTRSQFGNQRMPGFWRHGVGGSLVVVAHFPNRHDHSDQLVGENLDSQSGTPPVVRIEIRVVRRYYAEYGAGWKGSLADVARTARMKIRRNQNNSLPVARGNQLADGEGLVTRIFGAMGEAHDGARRHAAIGEVVFLEFGDAGVGTEIAAAGHDSRRPSRLEQFGSARGSSAAVGVLAQNHDGVRSDRAFVHGPEIAGHAHQRMARQINENNQGQEKYQEQQAKKDPAAL